MKTTTLNERILTLIDDVLKMSYAAFADEIGVQRSGIAHIVKGRNKPSLDMVQKIIDRYPEVNVLWLLRGTGTPLSTTPNVISLQSRSTAIPAAPVIDDSLKNTLFDDGESTKTQKPESMQAKAESPVSLPKKEYSHMDFVERGDDAEEVKPARSSLPIREMVDAVKTSAVSEKKINKIMVFFDDNSYQEFLP